MDWTIVLWIVGGLILFYFMMRMCGGMMMGRGMGKGGCGMGRCDDEHGRDRPTQEPRQSSRPLGREPSHRSDHPM